MGAREEKPERAGGRALPAALCGPPASMAQCMHALLWAPSQEDVLEWIKTTMLSSIWDKFSLPGLRPIGE